MQPLESQSELLDMCLAMPDTICMLVAHIMCLVLCRMVEDMTARTMELTPPLIPNGSHWRLPRPDWVQQQQQQAAQHPFKTDPWWRRVLALPARLLGLVDDSLQTSDEPFQGQHLCFSMVISVCELHSRDSL